MNRPAWTGLLWLFSLRTILALICLLLVIGSALALRVTGVRIIENITGGECWLWAHSGYFFVWRLLLYASIARLWWRLRTHLQRLDSTKQMYQRIGRIEISAAIALILLESLYLLYYR